ncbi:hypothetical protein B296_00002165 [Ensete ventricosum]|uniref:Heat shock 70 kDa protein 14 n=1 Tax=Ensete ventricosum TaxID=4639 RepID=A0A427AEJ4_ENSVE|nr:hypothetical protein B296_00002165 [Ensete ventricosum]
MSVVGFDVGNESCIVAVARQRGIDVVLNDESKRETPAIVCFGEKQRFIGTAGAASSTMNPKNSVSQIKRLLGRKFSDPEVQKDIQSFPFKVTEGPDGFPLIHANYLGEQRAFTPTQILAMVLSNLKSIAEKNLNAAVVDCCIGIPVYFNDLQRRAMTDAATIAGLHPLRLFHETTATALAYGIYKTDLPENDQLNVAFVDVGHASMQVCIAGYKKGQLKILAHAYDRSLGGRDFDEVLFRYFAAKFKDEYKIDVYQNARACLRLRTACEKLKKVLSANPEAPLNIECLMDEKDVRGFIKRDEFEKISIPILEQVRGPLEKALSESGLSLENIHTVEVVGSGSRVPAIIKILTEFFRKEPRRTMNASECVARGSALQCAILSPTFKVREFQIGPFHSSKGERAKLKVKVHLNLHGIVSVESATVSMESMELYSLTFLFTFYHEITLFVQMLEEEEVEVPVSAAAEPLKESTKTDMDELTTDFPKTETDVKMEASRNAANNSAGVVDTAVPESDEKSVQMETDNKVEAPKKKVKKTTVPVVELVYGGMLAEDLQKAVEKEFEMALQDRVMEETKEKKNAVEAYVYDMRNKYQEFVMPSEKDELIAKLQEVEDWLYEEGEDETKGVYVAKLEELQKTPPTAAPGEQSQAHELQNQGENASGEPMADEDSHAPPPSAAEPMDTDKSETVPSA